MSMTSFKTSTPVITETNYDVIRLHPGEGAYTENFNRSIIDGINRDGALEAALTYLGRSSAFTTTDNTELFIPGSDNGVDAINKIGPTVTASEVSEVFTTDPIFEYTAFPQKSCINLASYSNVDATMRTPDGWIVSGMDKIGGYVKFTNDYGVTVTTDNLPTLYTTGTCTITHNKEDITTLGLNSGDKVSFSFNVYTTTNLKDKYITVSGKLDFLDSNGNTIATDGNAYTLSSVGKYNDRVRIENLSVPSNAKYFRFIFSISFSRSKSIGYICLSDIMVQTGEVCTPYVKTVHEESYLQYNDVVDLTNDVTILSWSKYSSYAMKNFSSYMGPLFIKFGNVIIGGVHSDKYVAGTKNIGPLNLQVYINSNGNVSKYTSNSSDFTVYDSYIDDYILSAIRIRKKDISEYTGSAKTMDEYIVEYVAVNGKSICKSSVTIPCSLIDGNTGTIIVGGDKLPGVSFIGHTTIFNSSVAQIRYEKEWVNDLELYVLSLSKKPLHITHSNSNNSDVTSILTVGCNLIENPTAHSGLYNWDTNYSDSGFSFSFDSDIGDCFIWSGTATKGNEYLETSNYIPVISGEKYTLQAITSSSIGTTGNASIEVNWYKFSSRENNAGDVVGAYDSVSGSYTCYINSNYTTENTILSTVVPSTATHAKIRLKVPKGANSSKLLWSKLKFERGSATIFSDDTRAGTAWRTAYYADEVDIAAIIKPCYVINDSSWGDLYSYPRTYNYIKYLGKTWGDIKNSTYLEDM